MPVQVDAAETGWFWMDSGANEFSGEATENGLGQLRTIDHTKGAELDGQRVEMARVSMNSCWLAEGGAVTKPSMQDMSSLR